MKDISDFSRWMLAPMKMIKTYPKILVFIVMHKKKVDAARLQRYLGVSIFARSAFVFCRFIALLTKSSLSNIVTATHISCGRNSIAKKEGFS